MQETHNEHRQSQSCKVSLDEAEEINLKKRGFNIIDGNLNQGAGGNYIRLWYKRGPVAMTKVQVSFNCGMVDGWNRAGYTGYPQRVSMREQG
ncbi:hypothetical protein KUCAC02_034445 [Chaenocephalus aceratus]|nr:hypothetical protein KUCAC02_034445 [Chaenocephalus aceratus]